MPVPHPFDGQLLDQLSADVRIEGKPAAVLGSNCMMPTAPAWLRAFWSSRDSWYPCAATIR